MLGTGPGIGPPTLLLELHSAPLSGVPTEVLEPAVRSCPVMHWSKEDTRNNFAVLVFISLFTAVLVSLYNLLPLPAFPSIET